jgi:catechol 2,3-dioxygenase-like lactoylglutathione lyase family enzyme
MARRPDLGLTHVALNVRDAETSIAFYERFARMRPVHRRRGEQGHQVVWLSDCTRAFAVVLIESERVDARLDGVAHLGVACASREEVDGLAACARGEGCLVREPRDGGAPVGYWTLLRDPDGHNLELSYGQEVGATVGGGAGPR